MGGYAYTWFSIYRKLAPQPFLPSDLFSGALGTFLHEDADAAGHFADRYDQMFLSPCCDCPGWKDPTILRVLVTGVSEWSELSVDEKSYEYSAASGDQRSAIKQHLLEGVSAMKAQRTHLMTVLAFRFTTSRNV